MARKIIALTLCVMMLASIIVVPAFADEISYADYVPGEMPENMFRTNAEVLDESQENYSPYGFIGNVGTSFSNADPRVSRGSATNGVKITANGTPGEIMSGSAPAYYYTNGVYFGDKLIKGNNFVLENGTKSRSGDIAGNKNYVYSIQVKNLNADIVPNVHVLLYDLDAVGYSQYSKEYGAAGMAIEGTDWVDLKGTIKNADDSAKTHTANDVDRLSIGFPASTTYAGSSVEINCTDSGTGKHLPYFAEEAVYDITNTLTSSSDIVTTKNPAVFEAQIVNQIGLPGYLEQGEFIWKAMNTDRTEEISGITISADGATAEVTVDETVEFGSYDIVAYNSTYNMAKGYTITVAVPGDYDDYVPGEMPANMFKTNAEVLDESIQGYSQYGFIGNVAATGGTAERGTANSNKSITITANGTAGEIMSGTAPAYYYTHGVYFGDKVIKGNNFVNADGTSRNGDIAGNKNYVYSIQVKNLNADIVPKVHVLLYDLDHIGYSQYSKEYGAAGMDIEGTDWVDLKGTIRNADDSSKTHTANDVDRLSIGFSASTTYAGSKVEINCIDEGAGKHLPYFAEEAIYDITNELESGAKTIDYRGKGAVLKAQLVNQVGFPGYLTQGTFSWKAFDVETRTNEISGITVTPSDDTTTATVTVDNTVAPGEYVIVAKSDSHDMAKGYVITVAEPNYYEDYIAGEKPANLIDSKTSSNATNLQFFTQTNTSVVKVAWNSWTQIRATSQVAYDGTTKVGKAGYYMPGALVHGAIMPDDTIENDANYVISYYAKAAEGLDGTVRDTYTNAGITNYRYESRLHTTKEYGEQGMPVTSDWTEFKGTIYVEPTHPVYANQRASQLTLGLSTEALAGTGVIISDGVAGQPGKVYFAKEVAYDITNELAEGSSATLAEGASATFEAEVINQLGLPGYLNQNFEWKVMNKERTEDIDGFVITEGEDGTATVKVDGAASGTYAVVACSTDYKMVKGFEITVTEDVPVPEVDEEITMIAVDETTDGLMLGGAKVEGSDRTSVTFAVVSYNGTVGIRDVDAASVDVTDGVATLKEPLTITAQAGDIIKVFAWDSKTLAPIAVADGVTSKYVK